MSENSDLAAGADNHPSQSTTLASIGDEVEKKSTEASSDRKIDPDAPITTSTKHGYLYDVQNYQSLVDYSLSGQRPGAALLRLLGLTKTASLPDLDAVRPLLTQPDQ